MNRQLLPLFLLILAAHSVAEDQIPADIIDSRLAIKAVGEETYVFSVGAVRNNADHPMIDVSIEARYLDAGGTLIDTSSIDMYSITILPGDSAAFKMQSLALSDEADYASQDVRVVSGYVNEPAAATTETKEPSRWKSLVLKLLISSFPILLLIAVWIYFIRKMGGKNSHQCQTLALITEQNELVRRQADALDRLADSVASRAPEN